MPKMLAFDARLHAQDFDHCGHQLIRALHVLSLWCASELILDLAVLWMSSMHTETASLDWEMQSSFHGCMHPEQLMHPKWGLLGCMHPE